jgi:hypothetical protein
MTDFRKAGAEILRVLQSSGDPSQEAGRALLYAKLDGGVTKLYAIDSSGNVTAVGGGSSPSGGPLSIYGDGSFGDHTTSGDETWHTASAPPGAPTVPSGSTYPFAFFNNLTIGAGHSVTVGGLTDQPTQRAIVIFVKGTLTIGAGGRIHANGATPTGGFFSTGGLGRNAIVGSTDGGNGGDGQFANGTPDTPGSGGTDRPALSSATRVGGTGGTGGANAGSVGGSDAAEPSWPYSLAVALQIAALAYPIGGGNGGGGGGAANSSAAGGAGGGGAGTLVIFAKTISAPAGSIQAIGGNGVSGASTESQAGAGGGGGTGGTIVIVTENTTLSGVTDVSGGSGGAGLSGGGNGAAGGDGEAIVFNSMLAAQIPA